jgi:hypothetical protein
MRHANSGSLFTFIALWMKGHLRTFASECFNISWFVRRGWSEAFPRSDSVVCLWARCPLRADWPVPVPNKMALEQCKYVHRVTWQRTMTHFMGLVTGQDSCLFLLVPVLFRLFLCTFIIILLSWLNRSLSTLLHLLPFRFHLLTFSSSSHLLPFINDKDPVLLLLLLSFLFFSMFFASFYLLVSFYLSIFLSTIPPSLFCTSFYLLLSCLRPSFTFTIPPPFSPQGMS